jgi:hypothetical protein
MSMSEEPQAAPQAAPDAPAQAPAWNPELETEARALGWKSPDEWQGDIPAGYIDNPERYLQRAESFTPFKKLKERLDEVARMSEKTQEALSKTFQREMQTRMAQLQEQKVKAVEVGDVAEFQRLEKQQAELSKEAAPQAKPQDAVPPDHRSAIDQWRVGKDWFQKDKVRTTAAVEFYGEAQQQGLSDPKAILAYVDQKMAGTFADLAPKAALSAPVEAGLTFGGNAVASGFEKLPKDAKDAFQRFVKQGLFQDTKEGRAAYAEDYNAA